jgi:flagellar motor switch protein FliM
MVAHTPPDGETHAREASTPRPYDFARPGKLSPALRKWSGYMHTDMAGRLEMALAGLLRDAVEVAASDLVEARWSEVVGALPSPCSVFTFTAPPLKGVALLRMDPGFAFSIVDRLFGGSGEPADLGRELTPIEERVVGRFADTVLAEIESAWKKVFPLKIVRGEFVSGSDLIDSGRVDETLLEVGFTLKSGPMSGDFQVEYPHHMFEPAFRALAPKRRLEEKPAKPATSPGMLRAVSLPVAVRLAPTPVNIKHLVDLGPGDVLMLDNRVSEDVDVIIGDKTVMKARPGSRGGRLAARITRFVEQGG